MGCRGTASCQPGQTDHGERGKRSARAGLLVAARQGPMPADGRGAWRSPRSSPSPGKPGTWRRRTAGRQQQKPFGRSGVNSPAPLDAKSASERVLGWQTRLHRWPRRHEARVARRGPGDPISLSRPPDPLAVGGERRNRTGHHPTGDRHRMKSAHNRPPHVLWRAGCSGMGKSGSAGGSRKRTGGNAGTAPRPDPASQAYRGPAPCDSRRRAARTRSAASSRRSAPGELRESFAQINPEPLRVIPVLETHHEVIGETHDHDITARPPGPPLVRPEVEDVVQVDVRKQR